jgi:hypothetical protein
MNWQENQLTTHLCRQLANRFERVKTHRDLSALSGPEWRETAHDHTLLATVYKSFGNLAAADGKVRTELPPMGVRLSTHLIAVGSYESMMQQARMLRWQSWRCGNRSEIDSYADRHTTISGYGHCWDYPISKQEACEQLEVLGLDCDVLGAALAEAGPISVVFGLLGISIGFMKAWCE